jgi:hypothetical protein
MMFGAAATLEALEVRAEYAHAVSMMRRSSRSLFTSSISSASHRRRISIAPMHRAAARLISFASSMPTLSTVCPNHRASCRIHDSIGRSRGSFSSIPMEIRCERSPGTR